MDAYRKQLGLKDFSPKASDAVALQQIKERGALPSDDRGDIRQAIDRCSNIWASLPGAGYGQFGDKADSLIAKFKEAGGTVREIADVWAESPRLSPLWLSASSSACRAVNHFRDNAITYKAQRDKCQRIEAGGGNYWHAWCHDVAALDAKYTKELADAKAFENIACVMMLSLSSSVAHQQSVGQCVITTFSGDNAASWLADTAELDYFTPQREADHYAKQLEVNPEAY